jgi:membrane associated rhomboid family serine protease
MASPELSVVCKSCGSEVSPYVTECPYCGTRLRRRAPKLERRGDELTARESRSDRRRRRAAERRERRGRVRPLLAAERPYVTIAAVLVPAALVLIRIAGNLTIFELGAINGTVGDEWWRYAAAPWIYDDIGYLFVVGLALAIFVPWLERRLGMIPVALLLLGSGALGMLAATGLDEAFGDGLIAAAGGNGVALGAVGAWYLLRRTGARDDPTEQYDPIAVTVAAMVLLALPAVESYADPWVGIAGGLAGLAAGFSATLGRR